MTQGRCGCLQGLPSYPHCQLPALPLRSSVPRGGGAPRGSHRNRSQGQDPRYAASVLGAHGGNLHPPSVPSVPGWGWGWGPWVQGPLWGAPLVLQPGCSWPGWAAPLSEIPNCEPGGPGTIYWYLGTQGPWWQGCGDSSYLAGGGGAFAGIPGKAKLGVPRQVGSWQSSQPGRGFCPGRGWAPRVPARPVRFPSRLLPQALDWLQHNVALITGCFPNPNPSVCVAAK